jgi:hypothetical protein
MENSLVWSSWNSGKVDFVESGDEAREEREEIGFAFFYCDSVACAAYLLAQPGYRNNMVYAPVREINGEGNMMYSELNTVDWWWKQQLKRIL